jgi:hypothetical protein
VTRTARALPIAVVLDGAPTPAWQAQALRALDSARSLDVVEVHLLGRQPRPLLGRLRDAAEQRVFGVGPDPLAPAAVAPRVAGARSAARVVWLAERPPDDRFGGEVLSVRHDGRPEPADAAVARAIERREAVVRSELLLRDSGGREALVAATVSGVRPFSHALTRTLLLWKLAALVPRATQSLPGTSTTDEAPALSPPPPPAAAPSVSRQLARAAIASARVMVTRALFRRPWSVRVRRRVGEAALGWERVRGDELVRWGDSPVYADPFLFEHEGRHHLFVEEVRRGEKRGVISHTELRADGRPAPPPTPVLLAEHHLSYPFVFRHGDDIFMVPETSAARRIELHRAVDFPHHWELDTVLLDEIDAADATIVAHDGRLWLFTAVAAPHASSLEELHLFWAHEPRGPWYPHPRNPVVSDVRAGRPAGPVQRWDGRLVRPAQDGSRRYGWAVSFREIDELTPAGYAEHEIARLEPGDLSNGARATHHYARDELFEAIDVRVRAGRWSLVGAVSSLLAGSRRAGR